jgi:hypothetical protein
MISEHPGDAHAAAVATFNTLCDTFRTGDAAGLAAIAVAVPSAVTSHKASLTGIDAVAAMFGPFTSAETFELAATNVYIGGTPTRARTSAYLAGRIQGRASLGFGAVIIVDLERTDESAAWRVGALKLQLTWIEGDRSLRKDWVFPRFEKVWEEGDALPVLVSELDAPWHVYPNSLPVTIERSVIDTYARYSWGIDQADFGLLAGCYTEDAAGTFRPMGPLSGRQAIIGVLKDFRRAWPMMQHYGEVLGALINGDRAAIIVARWIPQANAAAGTFGAYYPMRLQRDGQLWRISWTEYRPNWFSRETIDLDALLAATLSGEGDWAE